MSLLRGFNFFFYFGPIKIIGPNTQTFPPPSAASPPPNARTACKAFFLLRICLLRWQSSDRNLAPKRQNNSSNLHVNYHASACAIEASTPKWLVTCENTVGTPCYVGSVKATQGVPPLGGRTNESGPPNFLFQKYSSFPFPGLVGSVFGLNTVYSLSTII